MSDNEVISKFTLCVLLTQFGKTFTTISRISDELLRDSEFGKSIHLVFTMNTLLNNAQFSCRLDSIEKSYGKGSVVVFASKYSGPYVHVKSLRELLGCIVDAHTCPRVVVMCSNDIRFEEGVKFANVINSNESNVKRAFAYYDELHKYINDKLRAQIESLNDMEIVKGIMALSATPDKIIEKTGFWSRIQIIHLEDFNEADYSGFGDMLFNLIDDYFVDYKRPRAFDFAVLEADVIGFIEHTLNKHPEILTEGSKVFLPAHIRRVGHKEIRRIVIERCPRAVVVVLNGEEKTLSYDEGGRRKAINLTSTSEEVCTVISKKIAENKLEGRPLVITGFLCIGMGQTLMEKTTGTFTSAIISHLDLTNDELYQLGGRLTGRTKGWEKFRRTNIYCPTKIMRRLNAMEQCARNIAMEHNGDMITESDYLAPLLTMGETGLAAIQNIRPKKEKKAPRPKKPSAIEHPTAFATLKEVDDFLKEIFKKPIHPRSFIQRDGYTLSTRLPAYYKKTKDNLTAGDRLERAFFNNITVGMNISKKEGSGQPYMVYPVYESMSSAPADFKYYVRYMQPTAASP